ncbi:MAG: hypothetical protein AB9869_25025 [Verrucomicrobiia bacterium]
MKKSIIKSIMAALLLSSSATALLAQDAATPTCPLENELGYGRALTPEQRIAHRAVVQQLVTELQAKREAGTITPDESAWLEQHAAARTCPLGHEPGYGRTLTPKQRAAQRAIVQQLVTELQAKREAGTITAEELAWLGQFENRGGRCINGQPRGPRAGKGQGQGAGFGHRRGLRDGNGPRSVDGTCPMGNTPAKRGGR